MRFGKQVTATALALLMVAALAACGTETIDSAQLETELADQLAPQGGLEASDVTVDCPEDVEAEQGNEFNCSLTTPNGDEVQIDVTLTDDEGGFDAVVPTGQGPDGG